MDKTCGICRGPHFTADCPNQQHISHGDTRVETDPSILHRQVADKPAPKRPTPWDPKPRGPVLVPKRSETRPQTVTPPVTKPRDNSHASVTECPRCVTLERDAITLRNKIAALEGELKAAQATSHSKKPALTAAERQRRARQRKAAKAHVKLP